MANWKRPLVILGTGVHAIEMTEIVERVNAARPTWDFKGFIESDQAFEKRSFADGVAGYPVMKVEEALTRYPDVHFVPSNAWPKTIAHLIPTERMATLIDPTVFVSKTATIGRGCVFYPNCFIGLRAVVGDFTFCLANATINHDDVVGDRVIFATGATLAGHVRVDSDCYLGQQCTVRQKVHIGANSLIGMGAVVVKDVPPNTVVVGNPARKLRDR